MEHQPCKLALKAPNVTEGSSLSRGQLSWALPALLQAPLQFDTQNHMKIKLHTWRPTDPAPATPSPFPSLTPRTHPAATRGPLKPLCPWKRCLPASLFPQALLPPLHTNDIHFAAFSWGAGPSCSSSLLLSSTGSQLPSSLGDSRSAHTEPFQQPSAPNTAPVFPVPVCRAPPPPEPTAGTGSWPRGDIRAFAKRAAFMAEKPKPFPV